MLEPLTAKLGSEEERGLGVSPSLGAQLLF